MASKEHAVGPGNGAYTTTPEDRLPYSATLLPFVLFPSLRDLLAPPGVSNEPLKQAVKAKLDTMGVSYFDKSAEKIESDHLKAQEKIESRLLKDLQEIGFEDEEEDADGEGKGEADGFSRDSTPSLTVPSSSLKRSRQTPARKKRQAPPASPTDDPRLAVQLKRMRRNTEASSKIGSLVRRGQGKESSGEESEDGSEWEYLSDGSG